MTAVAVVDPLDLAWRAALDRWSHAIELARPIAIPDPDGALAFIDLGTRQTHVNFAKLAAMGVLDHLPCVLAHEVGHHIRYPHTIAESRRMMRFLRETAREVFATASAPKPDAHDWLLNVFFDLLINDELVSGSEPSFEDSFVAIFRALRPPKGESWGLSFAFFLGIFEELWGLEPCAMLRDEDDAALSAIDDGWRARARTAGEFVRGHPENRPLQLTRFLVAMRPFVMVDDKKQKRGEAFEREPVGCSGEALDGDAIGDLMRNRPDEEAARKWLREVLGGKGITGDHKVSGPTGGDPLTNAMLTLEGMAPADELAIAVYKREAAKGRIELPASIDPGEPILPGPHVSWDLGDDAEALDWLGSVIRAGGRPIPGISTFARERLPDEPKPGERETPWIELYLDSSGSMPNPQLAYSHQIEAGFILVEAATRAGGRVRVIQYSSVSQRVVMKDFTRSPRPAHRALVEYIGGGTDFPWDELQTSTERFRRIARVRRVVFSDSDFLSNAAHPPAGVDVGQTLRAAADVGGITALLNIGGGGEDLEKHGLHVIRVTDWKSVGDAARTLADALFRRPALR